MFHNGPAGNSYNWGRQSFYGITGTPTVKIDGLGSSSTPSSYAGAINARLAVPSIIDIDVSMIGDANGGTAYISVTAEQAPAAGTIKINCVILEDHEIASSAWGYYSGHEMMWIPVAFPLGNNGSVLNFTGPYPQTLQVSGGYSLVPSQHPIDNLNVATYVQYSTGSKEVLNASFDDMSDTTGISYQDTAPVVTSSVLNAWPNPSTGAFAVSSFVPQGAMGTVEIFDISGRSIHQFTAGSVENLHIEETGVYFVRLTADTGEIVKAQVAVIR